MNKCINCAYFLNCSDADPNIKSCDKFQKAERNIIQGGDKKMLNLLTIDKDGNTIEMVLTSESYQQLKNNNSINFDTLKKYTNTKDLNKTVKDFINK